MIDIPIGGFIAKLAVVMAEANAAAQHALGRAASIVEAEAKAEIGVYQGEAAPFAAWAELADATKDDRVRKGYAENDPLLRDGTLRDSITHEVETDRRGGGTAVVGSEDEIAVYQEMGTDRIPPRSFLGGALVRKTDVVVDLLGESAVGHLIGSPIRDNLLR